MMRATQKHLAMPSSPFINSTLSPRSSRFFIAPLSTHGRVDMGCGVFPPSTGGDIIWLIKSNAFWRSSRLVKLKIVIEHTSCLENSESWQKRLLQSMKAPPMDAMAYRTRK
jgi:hypothetical protein